MNMFQKLFGFKSYADFGRNEGEMIKTDDELTINGSHYRVNSYTYGGDFYGNITESFEATKIPYRTKIEAEWKDKQMTPMKLDTKAIRKRLGEAVVCCYDGELRIMIPTENKGYHLDLVYGSHDKILTADWTIRPGDRCLMSDDGVNWLEATYAGYRTSDLYPFAGVGRTATFIRPVPTISPEKKRILEEIEKAEKAIAELKRINEGMK